MRLPHLRSPDQRRQRFRDWLSYLDFLQRRALASSLFDKRLQEHINMPYTTYYPGAEDGEVLADGRGRGTFQRPL